jgi:hypothetical protein
VRVYLVDDKGARTLIREEKDTHVVLLEGGFRGKVQVSVTPGCGECCGPEYFSETFTVED